MANLFHRLKTHLFPINRALLILKFVYGLIYSMWLAVFTYVSLISTQIIDYNQLAIIHACVPVTSILGPVVIGFVADKVGNYKSILMICTFLGGLVFLPVLWLQTVHQSYRNVRNQTNNGTIVDENDDPSPPSILPESHIFPILLVIRVMGFLLFDASNSLLDSSGLSMAKKHNGDFGRQKMWSMISMVAIPLICGLLVDSISRYRGFDDYSSAFYICTGISVIVLPLIGKLDVDVQKNKESVVQTAKQVIGMIDVDAFLVVEAVAGMCWGWQRSFFVVYTDVELQASKTLLGGAVGIGGISSMIMFWTAKHLIGYFGAPTTLGFSLVFTAVRFASYFYLRNPSMILLIEALDGLSGFLAIASGSYYCAAAAPSGMLASMNGILSAFFYGAGRGAGLTIGSLLISAYGIRFAYLTLGLFAGGTSLVYMIVYHSVLKRIEVKRLMARSSTDATMKQVPAQSDSLENGIRNASSDLNECPLPSIPINQSRNP